MGERIMYQTEYYKVSEVPTGRNVYRYEVRVRTTGYYIGASAKLQNAIQAAVDLQNRLDNERNKWEWEQREFIQYPYARG